MTQQDFAGKIEISRSNLGNIETGEVTVTDRTISSICRMFNVNENWLRTGEGEMFVELSKEDQLMQWATDVLKDRNDSFRKRFVTALSSLGEEEWELIEKFSLKLLNEIHSEKQNLDIPSEEELQQYVINVDDIDENDPELHPDIRKHVISEKAKKVSKTKKEIG